ncbi:MAG: FtsX-like permease family protein [Myxococcota bacterium]
MRSVRLFSLVLGNLRRSRNHFLLASIGIVVGIATFAFFLALGLGVRQVVLGKIFPLDKIEVVPKSLDVNVGPLRLGVGRDALDDAMVERIGALPGVKAVYPKMKLTVGSVAYGGESLFGTDLRSEIVADGVDPDLLTSEINKDGFEFVDYETPERLAAEPPTPCESDEQCGETMYCGPPPGTTTPRPDRSRRNKPRPRTKPPAKPKPQPRPSPKTVDPAVPTRTLPLGAMGPAATQPAAARPTTPQPATTPPAKVCRHFVPVIVSAHVVELYNGTLRRAHGFPQLNPEAVRGFKFDLVIGQSMVAASNKDHVVRDRGMFVGFSDKAIPLGLTLPLGYVQRYNVEFGNEEDAQRYHSVVVEVPTKDDVAQVAKGVADLDLQVKDTGAEEAALLIAVFMMVFGLVSAVIVGIAAVNIMHVFFMLVYERQREIGVMRAVGASQGDIARIILGEAASLGTAAGTVGLVLASVAASIFDHVSASYVPDFPYKPTTYFEFPWWLIVAALAFSISFCVLGAALPARRAARMEPARVLSGN